MNYSLKELSERFSVTKMTVLNHARRLNLELEKVDNALVITDEQALKIGKSINNQKPVDEKLNLNIIFGTVSQAIEEDKGQDNSNNENLQNDIIKLLKQQLLDKENQILFLEKQMNVKDHQINKLNETLDNQQKLLHNQQSLALQGNEKIKVLEAELQEVKGSNLDKNSHDIAKNNNVTDFYKDLKKDSNMENSKGFLSRFFKK